MKGGEQEILYIIKNDWKEFPPKNCMEKKRLKIICGFSFIMFSSKWSI